MVPEDAADATRFEIEEFGFIGRTFEEYAHMFDLDGDALSDEAVLDCPSGPGSFVATAHEKGVRATGVDVLYDRRPDELARRCRADYETTVEQLAEKTELFAWDFYGGLEERKRYLRRSYETFLADYPEGRREGRYVHAELPRLPFGDGSFSLVLSAHFLFLYGDRLSFEFHLEALREMLRVATGEVRVFPVVGLDTEPYDRLDDVLAALEADGYDPALCEVPFEFQRGATEMLVVPA